jgi:Uma2 family endonuclease
MATEYRWQPEWELLESEEERMPTFEHGIICTNLSGELRNFLKGKNLGRVVDSSVEYRFLETPKGKGKTKKPKKPPRSPDVSFIQQERLPQNVRSYPEIAPDLVVEVASPTDRIYDIQARVQEFQKAGVKLIWMVYPYSRTVDVYRLANGPKFQAYIGEDELVGEDVIPGFTLRVNDIFDYPLPPEEEA